MDFASSNIVHGVVEAGGAINKGLPADLDGIQKVAAADVAQAAAEWCTLGLQGVHAVECGV